MSCPGLPRIRCPSLPGLLLVESRTVTTLSSLRQPLDQKTQAMGPTIWLRGGLGKGLAVPPDFYSQSRAPPETFSSWGRWGRRAVSRVPWASAQASASTLWDGAVNAPSGGAGSGDEGRGLPSGWQSSDPRGRSLAGPPSTPGVCVATRGRGSWLGAATSAARPGEGTRGGELGVSPPELGSTASPQAPL